MQPSLTHPALKDVCVFSVSSASASASEEQKGSGLFFGSESEPRTDDVKC